MTKTNIEGVIDVYDKCKSGNFNGMVFIKFASTEKREVAMQQFNAGRNSFAESRTFMNKDLPVEQRVKFSFLLNCKKLLTEWKFENVSFDDETGTLSVAGLPVLRVATDGFALKLTWLSDEWAQWKLLTEDPKFNELIKVCEGKLEKASASKGKGETGPV